MLFTQSTNIYETFYPLNMVLKCFGLFPVSVSRHNSKRPKMTLIEGFFLSFWLLCYLLLFAMNLIRGQQEPEGEKSLLLKHGLHMLHVFQTLILLYVVVINYTEKISIIHCFRLIDHFDLVRVMTLNCHLISNN